MQLARGEAEVARQEALQLREHIIATSMKPIKIPFQTGAAAFTAVLLIAAVSKLVYFGFTRLSKPTSTIVWSMAPSAVETPLPRHILTHKPLSAGALQFKNAMSRLQDDLGSMPEGESEIVREVNRQYPHGSRPCPLEWSNGAAALSLEGNERLIALSLTTAVTECATAVEKFRDDREAAFKLTDSSAQ